MSLIEVVVAAVLLGILSSAVLAIILQTQTAGVSNRARIAAASLAAREIDMVRDQFTRTDTAPIAIADAGTVTNPDPRAGQTAGDPFVIDGTSYTVVRSVHWNITGDGASACTGGSLVVYPTLGVTVIVTWPNMGSVHPVVSTASFAPAKGNGIPGTASFVAVSVVDDKGNPNVGRTVTVTGGTETKTGLTDASGCAVIQVSPAAGLGTSYTAQVSDPGYVNISGDTAPSLPVGTVTQGQLNNNVKFAYAKAAHLVLRLVDGAGNPLPAGPLGTGAGTVTVVASESSTASSSFSVPVSGVPIPTIDNLWPTQYGAYFGTTAPAAGYTSISIGAGETGTLDVPLEMATGSLSGVPAGTTSVKAIPVGASGDCSATGAITVDPSALSLLPGDWSFFATGPTFTCSAGPSASLQPGANAPVVWGATTLQVNDAPAGKLWAVDASKVSGTLTTCPGSTYAGVALSIDGALGAPLSIPAGDWYVYVTSGAADGPCVGIPAGNYPKAVAYDGASTIIWSYPVPDARVSVTAGNYVSLVASPSSSTCRPTGAVYLNGWQSPYTATLPAGTWYIWSTSWRGCGSLGGTVIVGGATSYSLTFSSSHPPVVGP
ncbi:hypothetical protein [Cellulomonas sp. P24]|uniref:hypothetical protein n=1 Tax=Cellulomonas sp. P24 TaxID=2885206 RepID=UPI00216B2E9A|nr:hypothetical protein [Cellulomonas sp. P24]MCR6494600.1 hypothetical protein [Cellulomonas sp. P24]